MLKIDQKLMTQVPEIDTEHEELIQRAEKLMAAYQNGDPQQEIIRLLAFLQTYVVEHFQNEEALQLKWQYPEMAHHQKIHDEFKRDVTALYKDIVENGLTLESRLKFNYLINDWIYKHIGDEDRKLAEFIRASQ